MPRESHIAVVGAGIVGASIAFNLNRRGARVTVLDAGDPGQGASAVSFAWINARDKTPRHYHDLNRRSMDMWDRFARRLGRDVGLTWGGELRWAATPAGGKELARRVVELQSWGYAIELLDADGLAALEPGLAAAAATAASYSPADGHVDPPRVVRACLDGAAEGGAQIHTHCRLTGLRLADGRVRALHLDGEEMPCDAVVLAGGPDTVEIAAHAGVEVPLAHTFGATLFTEPVAPVFNNVSVVHTPRDLPMLVNFRQLPDGSVQIHGGSHGGPTDGSLGRTENEVDAVYQEAVRFLPAIGGASVQQVRRGRRPMPKDGLPVLGFAESVPNLYLAAMHSGVTLAALVGEFAASEILDRQRIDTLNPYRVERFYGS
ncbi:MAG: FAD-dependent oxidoreductase [Candidatus Latescibacteria bacterium]|nr:FAD-dependent oxidoreductase [Candidatus Latescibacterota bacterium]